jgi:hypothetical protein
MPSCDSLHLLNFLQRVQALDCVQRGPYCSECYEAVDKREIYEPKPRLTRADKILKLRPPASGQEQRDRRHKKDWQQDVAEWVVFVSECEFTMQYAGKGPGQATAWAGQAREESEKADLNSSTLRWKRGRQQHERQSPQGCGAIEEKTV